MPLVIGDKLGHYEVLSLLGHGGMGEVYRARDTTLKRDVALKVLPAAFLSDLERMARFQREAEVLASLDHPNIGPIHGIVDAADSRALVLALIEGPTLADRIEAGPVPQDEALAIAKQIVEALEYAHDRGVVHRDLKPANIKITPEGAVKVLDFGLAKVLEDEPPVSSLVNSPTLTVGHTRAGMILGTASYMSPEQAVGRSADRRSDIFSFGAVLYEMLTGQRAFGGATTPDVLEAVVKNDPDWSKLPAGTPAYLRRLLERTLAKDRKQRLQAIGEARIALENPAAPAEAASAGTGQVRRPVAWMAVAAALLLALAGLAVVHFRERPQIERNARFQIPMPEKSSQANFRLSPDGRYLAIALVDGGRRQLLVRPLDALEAQLLPGTEGASYPFWSPDSAFIGFFAKGKLKKIAVTGGPVQALCDVNNGRGASWNRDGVIVFASLGLPLRRVASAGGAPVAITKLSAAGDIQRFPEFLPDGKHVLYLIETKNPETSGVFASPLEGGTPVRVLADPSNVAYVAGGGGGSGYLLFRRDGTLMSQAFDPAALRTTGDVLPRAEQVSETENTAAGAFSASENGILAYSTGGDRGNLVMAWMDRTGKRLGTLGQPGAIISAALSPDERKVAYSISSRGGGQTDLWTADVARGVPSRFTSREGRSLNSVWSPDGTQIVFGWIGKSYLDDLYRKPSNGAGMEELLVHAGINASPLDWSRDGRYIVYQQYDEKTDYDLWLLPLDGDHKPVLYLGTQFDEEQGQISPDGRWIAYRSNESGEAQVYVQAIPASGAKWAISAAGGSQPRWRRDGKELFYVAADQKLMAVPVKTGGTPSAPVFEPGTPQTLFGVYPSPDPFTVFTYQPSADGQRFLVTQPANEATFAARPVTVVLNWQTGSKN